MCVCVCVCVCVTEKRVGRWGTGRGEQEGRQKDNRQRERERERERISFPPDPSSSFFPKVHLFLLHTCASGPTADCTCIHLVPWAGIVEAKCSHPCCPKQGIWPHTPLPLAAVCYRWSDHCLNAEKEGKLGLAYLASCNAVAPSYFLSACCSNYTLHSFFFFFSSFFLISKQPMVLFSRIH